MIINRRTFLAQTCAIGAATLAVQRFGLVNALAQSSGYRALVCIFLFGGNDSNNLVIPLDDYSSYEAVRTVATNVNIARDTLLPVAPPSAGGTFGLHPGLSSLVPAWNDGRLAVVCNVGPLVQPLTRAQYQAGNATIPLNLFSHSDQQGQWQTCVNTGPSPTGWGGRTVDRLGSTVTFPTMVTVAGLTPFTAAQTSQPLAITPGQPFRLNGFDSSAAARARNEALMSLLQQDAGNLLVRAATSATSLAVNNSQLLATMPPLATVFPVSSLGTQLQQVAQLIKLNQSTLGLGRQLFFCSLGGFDTHSAQATTHANLLTQLAEAMAAFYSATRELGVADAVTSFTLSDFARTLQPNGNAGTDHAWGGHHLVVGGAVRGGDFYGRYPTLALNGPDDTDSGGSARGRWIPTTAVDQYAATFAQWYGVSSVDLPAIFPNFNRFGGALTFL